MSARYIAICELSLAATYAKHGNWRLVGVCAERTLHALRAEEIYDAALIAEAQAYVTAAQTHIGG